MKNITLLLLFAGSVIIVHVSIKSTFGVVHCPSTYLDTLVASDANWSMMKTLAKKSKQNCKLCGTCQSFIGSPINLSPSQEMIPRAIYLPIGHLPNVFVTRINQHDTKSDLGVKDDSEETK
jgi:hypothetical protein